MISSLEQINKSSMTDDECFGFDFDYTQSCVHVKEEQKPSEMTDWISRISPGLIVSAFTPHRMHHVYVWSWGIGNKRYEIIRSKWKSWKTPFLWQRTCGTRLAIKWMGNEKKQKRMPAKLLLLFRRSSLSSRLTLIPVPRHRIQFHFYSSSNEKFIVHWIFFTHPQRLLRVSISHALAGKCTAVAYA